MRKTWMKRICAAGAGAVLVLTAPMTSSEARVQGPGPGAAQNTDAGSAGQSAAQNTDAGSAGQSAAQNTDAGSAGPGAAEGADQAAETRTGAAESQAESQPAAGPGAAQSGAASDQEAIAITEEQIDAYFDDSVFVGDSVMLGYRNYAMRRQDTWLSRVKFLCSGSYSTSNALRPVSGSSIHPIYAGQQRPIWESIALMGAKKVFICFGLNDLNISGIEGTCENYKTIVANIKALSPDAEIHLISMTYTLAGKGKGKLKNDNIRLFNDALVQLTAENGWGFVNLAPHLADANGDLALAYCSDYYVHLTPAAYDVWSQVMRDYAKTQLEAAARAQQEKAKAAQPAGPGSVTR